MTTALHDAPATRLRETRDLAPLSRRDRPRPQVSVVVPVRDEADNVATLIAEIHAALEGREDFELIYVDDGSVDDTPRRLAEAALRFPRLRRLHHRRGCGQSAAINSGVRAARGAIVITLDGDGQDDPANIAALLAAYRRPGATPGLRLVAARRAQRRDGVVRRLSSRVANAVRGRLLRDGIADTGCGLKVFARAAWLELPYFDHMHRFLPALMQREGHAVEVVAVAHRPRRAGRSKYGIWDRLWVGLADLAGVMWLQRRRRLPELEEGA